MTSVKSELVCNICKLFLIDPISLPCYCVICNKHTYDENVSNGRITCNTCQREHEIPAHGFSTSKMAKSILASDLHLSNEEKSLKNATTYMINELSRLQEVLIGKKVAFELIAYDFSEVRRKIELQRETLKNKIDRISLRMIELTREKENVYKQKLTEILQNEPQVNIEQCKQTLTNEYRKPDLAMKTVKQLHDELELKVCEFQAKLNKFDLLTNRLKSIEFKPNFDFQEAGFGKLILNNQLLMSSSHDDSIKVWDLETNECVKTLVGHSNRVLCLETIGNGQIASGSADNTIKIWDVTQNTCLNTITAHQNGVLCIKSLTENTFASGSLREIKIWNISTQACIQTLNGHANWVRCLIKLEERSLISCSDDKTIKFWNLDRGSVFRTLNHAGEVYCLVMLKNGYLASGSGDNTIKIWNVYSGECIRTLNGHTSYVWRFLLLEGGLLLSCSFDKTIKLWDVESGESIMNLESYNGFVKSIKMKDNGLLIICSLDGTIKTWNLETGVCLDSFVAHDGLEIYDLLLVDNKDMYL